MSKKKKSLCFLLSLSLLVSIFSIGFNSLAALQAYDSAASTIRQTYSGSLTISDVNYADSKAIDSEKAGAVTEINVKDSTGKAQVIPVDSTKYNATLTVDGVERDLSAGTYTGGNIVITLTNKTGNEKPAMGPGISISSMALGLSPVPIVTNYSTRVAAVIADGKLQSGYSVSDAIKGGATDSFASEGATINSQSSYFGGYLIDNSNYTISGLNMTLKGAGADDFSGWGAGITATDKANVTLKNAVLDTTGVIRTAIWVGGEGSSLNADNIVVSAHGDKSATTYSATDNYAVPMLERVPFALGLEGNVRATNVLGSATANYQNSIIASDSWGVLSTDSGKAGTSALTVSDTLAGIGTIEKAMSGASYTATKTVDGTNYGFTVGQLGKLSGYVAYADAGVIDTFKNVSFYSPDYIGIIASGTSTMNFSDSFGYSGRIGFMSHQTKDGALNITGGTFNIADTFVMIKSGSANPDYMNVSISGAKINLFGQNAQSGNLLQLIESDDAGGPFTTTYTIHDKTLDDIKAMKDGAATLPTVASFTDVDVKGNIYNSVYSTQENLNVTFDRSKITGVISSSVAHHVDDSGAPMNGKTINGGDGGDYLAFGRLANVAAEAVNNPVQLTLKNTAWTITGTSYLSSLTLDKNSSIVSGDGIAAALTVNGKTVTLTPGTTYTGKIILKVSSSFVVDNATGTTYAAETTYTGIPGSYNGRGNDNYSVGYYINKGTVLGKSSLLTSADKVLSMLELNLDAYGSFNPVIATGSGTDVTISGTINIHDDSSGQNASDFSGLGTAILAADHAKVVADGLNISTTGFGRTAFIADNYGQILVKNSSISVLGNNPLTNAYDGYVNSADQAIMISPPWVLGIQGGARGTNLLGDKSTISLVNSIVRSGGWGVLSTDAGQGDFLNVVDSALRILPLGEGGMTSGPFSYGANYGSGYGTYVIGNATENFYGATITGTTYASIFRGGTATYKSSSGTVGVYDAEGNLIQNVTGSAKPTTINSVFGFMSHGGPDTVNILDGTQVNTKEATFLYKDGDVTINADNAKLNPQSGILLQMMDNDDTTVGVDPNGKHMPTFNTTFSEKAGWPSINGSITADTPNDKATLHTPFGDMTGPNYNTVNLNLTNGGYKGSIYNGTGYYNQVGDVLNVTIGANGTLNGAVSLTETRHVNEFGAQNTSFTINQYYYLGHVSNRYYDNGNSKAAVILKDGGTWVVTDDCLLSGLTVGTGSTVSAPAGYTLTMTVDGVRTAIEAGKTYTGRIVLSISWPNTFNDVSAGAWYYSNVGYVVQQGLVDGTSTTTFAPAAAMTRGMLVTALYRLAGSPAAGAAAFSDVAGGTWYAAAVAWASANGIVSGVGNQQFAPNDPVTREQIAVILYNYAKYKSFDLSPSGDLSSFLDDTAVSGWAAAGLRWAVGAGLLKGSGTGTLSPGALASRAEAAALLQRFSENIK